MVIKICWRAVDLCHAYIATTPSTTLNSACFWGTGVNEAQAIANLVKSFPEKFGITAIAKSDD